MSQIKFNTIEEVLEDLKKEKMVIVVDDEDRENEGDLVMAAEFVTPQAINFMTKFGRGLICVPMTAERLKELDIPQMVYNNADHQRTAFTVSVDAKSVTTGISAHERAFTIKTLVDPKTVPEDLLKPGHIFPLQAKEGGVLIRAGHTEAAVDLAKLAGLYPAGVICEIMNEDGTMARLPQLAEFAQKHDLKLMTIADLITYRRKNEKLIKRVTEPISLPTKYGNFVAIAYESIINKDHHIALIKGNVSSGEPVLARIHSECLTGDTFGSLRCDCGEQLHNSMKQIEKEGRGVLLYMRQEGRGIGLINKLKAYKLQEEGKDTVEANVALGFAPDLRDYGEGAQILVDLGVKKLKLLTNNPKKVVGLMGYGLEIVERIPIEIPPNEINKSYMETKRAKMGHILNYIDMEDKS
ncbi:MAG TPA: bifunctional 3,4-dihydroxy-2-butanone-4-phosphate synthase/GTP cyclohydrolase II [Defluviitoga sp.]|nr:bifunctional 3,4-dihydroxy-2-butanone-4-phosphate synthase/GTP cyclohydrolase II [Defluviitoga sp.]HOP24493.1 bifunctional 3,4-dihydroxy-2-butanone-4-phosphate synthase/GTP cyclohydrolase II [Defluviitoga sp.]HQD62965.1 bifunctional 3,4-dihydroxy-2-butanone-4-phosphate synthase/GTP cyclohydrolase II [Defluviitoga sp.]